MADRSWFFAANGQQQGPYPDAQFRDLIARGNVNAKTLVWSEGMASWQKAGEVPGLMAAGSAPPAFPPGGAVTGGGGYAAAGVGYGGGPLSFEPGIWGFVGRSLLMMIGLLLVIPALILYVMWFVAIPVCVVEQLGPFRSLGRSRQLTKGHRWKILGLLLVILIPALIVGAILGGITVFVLGATLGQIVNLIWSPFAELRGNTVGTGWLDVGLEYVYTHRNVFGGDAATFPAGLGFATANRVLGSVTARF